MKCPVDVDVELVMSERQGIEIDYCPQCRGVWLDRGELDKILDRAVPAASPAAPPAAPVPAAAQPRRDDPRYDPRNDPRYRNSHDSHDSRDRHDSHDERAYGDKKKRKGSWLGDILDF